MSEPEAERLTPEQEAEATESWDRLKEKNPELAAQLLDSIANPPQFVRRPRRKPVNPVT